MRKFFAILCGLLCLSAFAGEVIPPAPAQFFNDYAGVASGGTAAQLNQELEQFEKDTSSQILVVVYPTMQSDSSVDDYCVRVFNSWHVGQKDKNNGAVLFVFAKDHKMFIQTGYGLEGALPDATCERIVADEIAPAFKAGNYDAGLTAGVNAMIAATKGEYKGNGQTHGHQNGQLPTWLVVVIVIVFLIIFVKGRRYGGVWVGSSGGWSSGGGGWSGGGGGGGGGGFSGGGGSSGGGGAGGSW